MKITGNTVLVAGGTSGLGRALAVAMQARGNIVIVGGRRTALLEQIAADHPGIDTVVIDTTDPASITTAVDSVLARYPELNVVLTMAGIMRIEDWHHPDSFLASAESVVTTDLLGPIRLIGALVEHLQEQRTATIMTVSSGLGFTPLKIVPSYTASKAAIHMLSESLRLQLADTSVEVLELVPPAVRTALLPGQENAEFAMPLDDFISEVMDLIENRPDAHEIQVEGVKFLRYSEARGVYDETLAQLNTEHPNGV